MAKGKRQIRFLTAGPIVRCTNPIPVSWPTGHDLIDQIDQTSARCVLAFTVNYFGYKPMQQQITIKEINNNTSPALKLIFAEGQHQLIIGRRKSLKENICQTTNIATRNTWFDRKCLSGHHWVVDELHMELFPEIIH